MALLDELCQPRMERVLKHSYNMSGQLFDVE